MHYARSENGIVAEVLRVDPFSICYPERAAMFRPCDTAVQIGWLDSGKAFTAPPAPALTVADFHKALYDHLDAFAHADGWDNRVTFMQRAAFPGRWQAWAILFCEWVDACEVLALDLLDQVTAGEAPPPASTDEFISLLPPPPAKP